MENKLSIIHVVMSVVLGVSIIISAIIFSKAFITARRGDRIVNVKGLAEREVDADVAIWPITFTVTGNDLGALQKSIDGNRDIIAGYLAGAGFTASEISQSIPKIRDNQAEVYGKDQQNKFRYIALTTVLLRSNKVALVKQAMENAGVMVSKGVVVVQDWQSKNEFMFTGLNKIKPEMIEEATVNARNAAEKFAKDSGSKLGRIRSATQGLFTVTDRDINTPEKKNVRVVTTVEYYLVDE
ncbi:MAG: SIMPL domain-containing protein [Bacteroidota bacterium]